MVLAKSKGVYSRLYETMGVNTEPECAKGANFVIFAIIFDPLFGLFLG